MKVLTGLFALSAMLFGGAAYAADVSDSVPEAEAASTPLNGWSLEKVRGSYWKYKDEKPLFSITAANVDQYADKLSPGQVALVKQKAGYRMDIYPTHRDCGLPDVVKQNSKANETQAKLDPTGNYLQTAVLPGVPFPKPKVGVEVMWNWLMRYRGIGIIWPNTATMASPHPGGKDWIETSGPQSEMFPWAEPGQNTPDKFNNALYSIYFAYMDPPALAGQGIMQNFTLSTPAETYYYFPGQRRVRRMPTYLYDAPQIGFENNYTIDEPTLFNGLPDRFDWKIAGQKTLYVPYNMFAANDISRPLHEFAQDNYINNDLRRYELHNVWVIEGTVKADARHVAPHKFIYIDGDSWNALVGEDYDQQGKLWKVREGFSMPIWELGGACDVQPFAQYDLLNGRYVFDQSSAGQGKNMEYKVKAGGDQRLTNGFYTAETLRSLSER